jgi:hypothetical protein
MPCSLRDRRHKQQRLPAKLFSARDRGGVQEPGGHRGREYGRQQSGVQILPGRVLPAHRQRQVLLEHARERREQLVRAAAVRRCAATPPCAQREGVFKLFLVKASSSSYGSLVYSILRRLLGYSAVGQNSGTHSSVCNGVLGTRPCSAGQYSGGTRVLTTQAGPGCSVLGWFSGHSVQQAALGHSAILRACQERVVSNRRLQVRRHRCPPSARAVRPLRTVAALLALRQRSRVRSTLLRC